MVTDNKVLKAVPTPPGVQHDDPMLGEEMGVLANFPVTTWDSFSFGQKFGKATGGFLLPRDAEAVPVSNLVQMRRRDAQTRSLSMLLTLPILACFREGEWVAPADAPKDASAEVEFANNMWNLPPNSGGMTVSKRRVLQQHLLALVEGFSMFEEVRQVPEEGPLKGKIVLRKLAHRDSRTLQFKVDDTGGFNGARQIARKPNGDPVNITIPKEKCLLYTVRGEESPFYGVSLFESAWYHYDIKSKLYYIAHLAAQFSAVPGRIGTYPKNATQGQRNAFRKALADFAANTSMILPEDWKVAPFNTGGSNFDFVKLIEHHSHLQAKSVLLQFADSENRMAIIDNGGKDASADMFVQALQSIMDEISELWTTYLMPKYIDWNFGTGIYPQFQFGQITDSARDAIKEIFTSIVTSSVLNCTPEFMRESEEKLAKRLGYDIDYIEIKKREAEAAKRQAEVAQAQADAAAQAPPDAGGDPTTVGPAGGPGDNVVGGQGIPAPPSGGPGEPLGPAKQGGTPAGQPTVGTAPGAQGTKGNNAQDTLPLAAAQEDYDTLVGRMFQAVFNTEPVVTETDADVDD